MKPLNRKRLVFVMTALVLLLAACGRSVSVAGVEIGIVPTETPVPTATPVPTPTLTPTPSPTVETYVNDEVGFRFEYLSHWTLAQEPHVLTLNQGTLNLRIGYRWPVESVDITGGRSGVPAGDWIYGDKVFFLDQVIPAQVLEYERKDKAVFYGGTGLIEAGDLVFAIVLEDVGRTPYEELDLSGELQAEVKAILESFKRIEAAGHPPAPSPAPPLVPTRTPTTASAGEKTQPSETVSLDDTWNRYTNSALGFSLNVPKRVVSMAACKWNEEKGDHSFRPRPAWVPVVIFEDANRVYIAPEVHLELSAETTEPAAEGGTLHFYGGCGTVTNTLALLQDPERPQQLWEIVSAAAHNDEELDAFIKARYGSGCSLGDKTASGQEGIYDVGIRGDGKDLSETACPLNYATVVKYYPEGKRVIAWDLGQAPTFRANLDFMTAYDQEMVESFRFLTGTPTAGERPATQVNVVGWYGSVHSAPAGSGHDDYLSVLPTTSPDGAGVAEVGLVGRSPALEAEIAELRDKEPPNRYAHFWGTLSCGVPDYGGCQLLVTHVRPDGPGPLRNPDPVEGWEGTVVTDSSWAQIDDAFVLAGPYPVTYGLWSEDPALAAQIEGYRNSGTPIRVWGQVFCGVPDANGCQIQVRRLEEVAP